MFAIDYYEDEHGRRPVEEFIDSLDMKMRAKVFGRLALLEEHGQKLGMPFSRHLEDGIYELRTSKGKLQHAGAVLLCDWRKGNLDARLHEEDPEDASARDQAREEGT